MLQIREPVLSGLRIGQPSAEGRIPGIDPDEVTLAGDELRESVERRRKELKDGGGREDGCVFSHADTRGSGGDSHDRSPGVRSFVVRAKEGVGALAFARSL